MKSTLLKFSFLILLFIRSNEIAFAFGNSIDTAEINSENNKAKNFVLSGKIDSANYYCQQGLQNSKLIHYFKGEADANYLLAKTTIQLHNNLSAMQQFIDAKKMYEKINDSLGIANCLLQLGIINYYEKNYDKALVYYKQSLKDFIAINNIQLAAQCQYLKGLCLIETKDYTTAATDLMQAKTKMNSIKNFQGESECSAGLAQLYFSTKNYSSSIRYYREALNYFLSTNNDEGMVVAKNGIGKNFLKRNKLDSATYFLTDANQQSKKINYFDGILESSKQLSELFSAKNDFKKAFFYQTEYYNIRDSLFNEQTSRKISTLQNEIDLSHKQNEIDELSSEKKVYKIWLYLFALGLILVAVILYLEWRSARLKQHLNKKLTQTNLDLSGAISELKSTQMQLVQSEKLASLGQLTAGIAHEINNPINFITSSVGSLKRDFEDVILILDTYKTNPAKAEQLKKELDFDFTITEIAELINGINEGASRTAEIVKGLRNFSRTDEGELKLSDLQQGIDSTLQLLQPKFLEKQIETIKNYQSIPQVKCFPGQINQVFMNILSNAADAIEVEKGRIEISTSCNDNLVYISIKDNGKGMSEATMQKIFDPFFTTKDVGKGTGLGMSIAYGIIEKHSGKIEIKSSLGSGTEFIISLPKS